MSEAARPALLICFDDAYAPAAAVTLESLLRNNPNLDADLYAAVSAVQPDRLRTLERLCADSGHAITFLEMDETDFRHFKTVAHISQAAYFRILAVDRIPASRILYLDVDLIVQTDLAPLLAHDMEGRLIAGVITERPKGSEMARLGVDADEPYLNSGVLLIDAARWRQRGITRTLVDFYDRHHEQIKWVDQDVINACLIGDKTLIDERWNLSFSALRRRGTLAAKFDVDGFDGIYHYSSNTKPWQDWFEDGSRALYEKYAATAPMRMAGDPMPQFYRDSFRYARTLWRRRRPGRAALAGANGLRLVARGVGRRLLRPFT